MSVPGASASVLTATSSTRVTISVCCQHPYVVLPNTHHHASEVSLCSCHRMLWRLYLSKHVALDHQLTWTNTSTADVNLNNVWMCPRQTLLIRTKSFGTK